MGPAFGPGGLAAGGALEWGRRDASGGIAVGGPRIAFQRIAGIHQPSPLRVGCGAGAVSGNHDSPGFAGPWRLLRAPSGQGWIRRGVLPFLCSGPGFLGAGTGTAGAGDGDQQFLHGHKVARQEGLHHVFGGQDAPCN